KKTGTGGAGASLARRRKGGRRKQQLQVPPVAGRRGKTLLELTNDTCRCWSCAAGPRKIERYATGGTPKAAPRSLL
ncbi:MAG: hypothetical protein WBF03_13190, partial [Xanthobacteraceae bacterium]